MTRLGAFEGLEGHELAEIGNLSGAANAAQLEAISATEGPVLIIAGPGSGKTFTLVERIVRLITAHAIPPESILVVTFTDKAARELTTRISNRLSAIGVSFNLNEMYVGTFHSVCLRLLEDNREFTRLKRSFTLFDQFDQQYFLYQRLNEFRSIPDIETVIGADQTGRWSQSEQLLKWLNKVGEEALELSNLAAAPDVEMQILAAAFSKYQGLLEETNSLDFSGIQYEALRLLREHPDVLARVRSQLRYLMVDEYQDTNTVQERILMMLAGDQQNLCVVGDDDQGLYRFRGATIRNILEFGGMFPEATCKRVTLTTNYRSHPGIIEFCDWWMRGQTWEVGDKSFRFDKTLEPRDADFPKTASVVRLSATGSPDQPDAWHAEVLAFLNAMKSDGGLTDWNQIAFLFRSVKSDRAVALARFLERSGIPVHSPRSNMFFEREEVRLVLGALIFLFPQFPQARKWSDDASLGIWSYYDDRGAQTAKPTSMP